MRPGDIPAAGGEKEWRGYTPSNLQFDWTAECSLGRRGRRCRASLRVESATRLSVHRSDVPFSLCPDPLAARCSAPASVVEHVADLTLQSFGAKPLLQEGGAGVQASLSEDGVVRVAGRIEDFQGGAGLNQPPRKPRPPSFRADRV